MTISTTITITGLKEAQDKLANIARELRGPAMDSAMRKATMIVTGAAKRNSPVDTGLLRASITPEVRHPFGNTVEGIVGSNVKYAPFMELGTKPHFPPLAALATWARRHGTTAFIVCRAIARRGLKPRFYLKKALEDNVKKVVWCFVEKIAELCQR